MFWNWPSKKTEIRLRRLKMAAFKMQKLFTTQCHRASLSIQTRIRIYGLYLLLSIKNGIAVFLSCYRSHPRNRIVPSNYIDGLVKHNQLNSAQKPIEKAKNRLVVT